MKKILFFIAMVVMIAAVASAQIAVTASGSAKTSFGVDLDDMDTGFDASGSGKISVAPEIDMASASSAVEEGDTVYGEFTIKSIELKTDDAEETISSGLVSQNLYLKIDGIAAKIVLGDLTINLWKDPSNSVDYNTAIVNAYDYAIFDGIYGDNGTMKDIDNGDGEFVPGGLAADSIPANAGIGLVYAIPSIADIKVDVLSHDIWTHMDPADVSDNYYSFRIGLALTAVENLTFEASMNLANFAGQFVAVGGKVGYKVAIGEEDSVTPMVGVMYKTDYVGGEMGVSGGVNAAVAGAVITANAAWYDTELAADGSNLDFVIAADLGGLVEGLTAQVAYQSVTVTTTYPTNSMGIHAKFGYELAAGDLTITPSVEGSYDDPNTYNTNPAFEADEELYLKADVSVAGLVDNTVFSLGWDSEDLAGHEPTKIAPDYKKAALGQLVLSAEVSL
jgi:hypothetical protein